jgi:hypothetical protein
MYWSHIHVLCQTKITASCPGCTLEVFRRTTLYDKVCQRLATCRWFSPGLLVSSTNKTDPHDITEILLKMALKTNKLVILIYIPIRHLVLAIQIHTRYFVIRIYISMRHLVLAIQIHTRYFVILIYISIRHLVLAIQIHTRYFVIRIYISIRHFATRIYIYNDWFSFLVF